MRELLQKVEEDKAYQPLEALQLLKETATAKFDETAEVHIKLGIDPKFDKPRTNGLSSTTREPQVVVVRPASIGMPDNDKPFARTSLCH